MSEPVVEDLNNFTFSQTDNSPLCLENSRQPHETSNLANDFNIDLNKTFDLNKYDEQIKASGGIKAVLEPLNRFTFDCKNQKKNNPGKLSQVESLDRLESDESLGILPDLLNDEVTFDAFKTELVFSEDEIHEGINSEMGEKPTSFIFSPQSDTQFNRISLFLKNISTPLPNFGNDRRYSSTPKVSASQFVANAADTELFSSPHFFPDEKEEPIAGSCHIKFETDFNLDDLKNVKPLASTYKTFSPPQLSSILNELGEQTDLKSEVNFKKKHETIENNLNVTQTFSQSVADLFPCKPKDNIQNVNILNNTFEIKQPIFVESPDAVVSLKCSIPSSMKISQAGSSNCNEKKVKTLDSTFQIPRAEVSYSVDCEKTFVIDFNSAVGEVSSKSICKDKMLNETDVFEMNSIESPSKFQEKIANTTFTKDLENDTQSSHGYFYGSHSTEFKPMSHTVEETFSRNGLKPIMEETFSENDFKTMTPILEEASFKNDFKVNKLILEDSFSENNLNEMLIPSKNILQSINSKSQIASPEIFNIKANVTFSEKVEILPGTKVTQNDNYLTEFASPNSPKAFASDVLHEKVEVFFHDQINPDKSENNPSNKMSFLAAMQPAGDATFSEEINERADQGIDKFFKSNSPENVNSLIELASPKELANATFNEEVRGKISLHNHTDKSEDKYDPANKRPHSDPLQSISDAILSEANEKSCAVIEKSYERDSFQNEISYELTSSLSPKISKGLTFSDRSEESSILESNVFQDSNDLAEEGIPNTQINSSGNQYDNCHVKTSFPKAIEECIFTGNASEETELSTHSISKENCQFEILPKSSNTAGITFSEKNDQLPSDMDSILNENDQVQLTENSLKELRDATFSEKSNEVQTEQISIPTQNEEFVASRSSEKEIENVLSFGLADKDMRVQPKQISHCNPNSLDETASSNLTKFCLKDTLSRKAADKSTSSLKSCSLESKTVVKNGLMKPTKIVFPRKVAEQRNCQLPSAKPLCKTVIDKKLTVSDLNHTVNLCDSSTDKSFSKDFNRRLTLSCSAESDANKSKYKNAFKKSFGIPSKLGIKTFKSNFQKSQVDSKYSNGPLDDISTRNEQNLLPQPDLISCKDSKIVEPVAVASVNAKRPFSSRLSFSGKLPLKSLKMKKCELMSDTALTYTAEKSNNKPLSCPRVTDLPRKQKPEIGINKANSGKSYSRHSIATVLPRKFQSFSIASNKTSNTKSPVIKQKSAPASNTCKPDSLKSSGSLKPPDSLKPSGSMKPPNSLKPSGSMKPPESLKPSGIMKPSGSMKPPDSVAKFKFSSLPKVQSLIKISSDGNKNVINKRPESGNQKSNGFLRKPCISEGEGVQSVETQISTRHVKLKDNTREISRPSSMFPSREQTVQSLKPLNVKKSNGQYNFLPIPKTIRGDIKNVNSNGIHAAKYSELQNQVNQQTSGKLPQLKRIPAPCYKK